MRAARVVLVALVLCGCGRGSTHSSTGEVIAVDAAAPSIRLRHDDIPGLMGPMTMTFPVYDAKLLAGLVPGTTVQFQVVRHDDVLVVTYLRLAGTAARPQRGIHDHTPHHGGIVTMVGMLHLEAVVRPPGRVRVYLSDVWRMPLPVAGASGTIEVGVGDHRRELPLVRREDALEADGVELAGRELPVHVRVRRDAAGEPIEAHFMLPLAGESAGAAGVPLDGCVPPESAGAADRQPRCVLRFASSVTSIAATPDGGLALVAVRGAGVSLWRMPAGEFVRGLATAPGGRPGGRGSASRSGRRHDRQPGRPRGGNRAGRIEAHAAGAVARIAVARGGGLVAATGHDHTIRTIRLHDVATAATLETLTWHRAPVWGLTWAGSTLVSGDADGNVALWDLEPETTRPPAASPSR